MKVKYVGEVLPHLTGHYVDVPDMPLYAATSWIELNLAPRATTNEDQTSEGPPIGRGGV